MKGVVFDMLRDMVEEQYGLEGWNAVLDEAGSEGMYVSTQTYPDEELTLLVNAAVTVTGQDAETLIFGFGEFMAGEFYQRFPAFFDEADNLVDFLYSVDQIVHMEVRKLYPDAQLPDFTYDRTNPHEITMHYRSPRKLCWLAEGLISGSARHYGSFIEMNHSPCMHDGADHCSIHVRVAE
ncbi:MAG: hypothetical protein CMI13_13445 [Oleibacter sp.]|nr:hypothetical protein [Thalassolituus sp.]|tara:strand:- start:334 stop:873 length:540 start_codon:yes stop_codon:yes gene_type:complete